MGRLAPCLSMVAALVLSFASTAHATTTVTIGSVTTGTRPGSDVGRNTLTTVPTLRYCITYTTTDQAMDYGYEVIDASGVRPPFGSSYSGFFVFVPASDWAAGSKMTPRIVCNTTTLETGKSYTVRAWATSGLLENRGAWAITGPTAPTLASYSHSTAIVTTTTTAAGMGSGSNSNPSSPGGGSSSSPSTTVSNPSSPGGSSSSSPSTTFNPAAQGGGVSCPASAPVVATISGSTYCVPLETYCASNPGWSDPIRGLSCPTRIAAPGSGLTGENVVACNSVISSQRLGRATIIVTTSKILAKSTIQLHVFRSGTWFVLGIGKVTKAGNALVVTESPIINAKRSYKIRAVQMSRIVCEGSLTVPTTMRLRGIPKPA